MEQNGSENKHISPEKETDAAQQDVIIDMPASSCGKKRGCLSDYWRNAKARPVFMLLPPVLAFCILCALSILGVVLGADKYEQDTRNAAEAAALDWAASFRLSTEKIFTPLVTLAIMIKQQPQLARIQAVFPETAEQLLKPVNSERTTIQELQVSPMGIIDMIYPQNSDTDTRLGINIFNQSALRGGALKTIEAREMIMNGPLKLVQGNFGTVARIPIFIQNSTLNETFGTGLNLPYNCTNLCFNKTTGEKFWGFATAIGPLDDLRAGNDSRLDLLHQKRYNWLMTRPYTATELNDPKLHQPQWTDRYGHYIFANSSHWPSDNAVVSDINIGNAVWKVYLEPMDGWRPSWEQGLIVAVVLGNLIVAALIGTIMASWTQQQKLLGDVLESNVQLEDTTKKLQDEKLRLDALLVRQYNLLAVLGGRSGNRSGTELQDSGSPDNSSGSKEGLTLDRIESMRRQLAVNSNSSAQDMESIQTIDLLGEGTFGKVYKGLWRGTVVAVKTMLLPSNMSGAEKREKMAVMEAAISSSLAHPNVVQTYTYAIRPMRELPRDTPSMSEPIDASSKLSVKSNSSQAAVHSYEVRLVLEFCDKGCLRDALDTGVFMLPDMSGVNFLAILDTAADVAKAMLHLHTLNVLHSDLKSHNVMLSTGNADGRGVVGKVGDFGLSVQMDHTETHISQVYQGTMTHMAPEIMLDGRVSKAADVYAFGITMWELYTARRAFEGVPRALLGHQITQQHLRPFFPPETPQGYKKLAEQCWQNDWEKRPTFKEVLADLLAMRAADPSPTPPLQIVQRTRNNAASAATLAAAAAAAAAAASGGSKSAGTNSRASTTGNQNSSSPSLPQVPPHFEGERSIYLERSVDDSDIIVMRSMSDWSDGASGMSSGAPSMLQRRRPLVMPQIVEAADGEQPNVEQLQEGGEGMGSADKVEQQLQQMESKASLSKSMGSH